MCQLLLLKMASRSERIENEGDGEKGTKLIHFPDKNKTLDWKKSEKM